MRERQCMSQLRGLDELLGLVGVWAYTGYSGQWEMSLLKLPQSVGWKFLYSEWRGSWNGMYDGRDGLCVWAYTGVRTWEGHVAVEAASVGRFVPGFNGVERRMAVM